MFHKKNIALILGFGIPVLMILFVVFSIYIPSLFIHPQYNFLYSNDQYYDNGTYSVTDNHIVKNPTPPPSQYNYRPTADAQLYIYDVKTNESKPVTFAEAQNLQLNPNGESPDGYTIKPGSQYDGLFGGSRPDYNTVYIVGHNGSKKLHIVNPNSSYYNPIHFLGWITQ